MSAELTWTLTYHSVAEHDTDPYNITVTPSRFAGQMRWLQSCGLRGRSVAAARAAHDRGERDVVAVTFDDGYADFATTAVPILRRFGFTATVYVLAGRMGGVNDWDREGPRKSLMSEHQVRQVAEAGMEVASHGLTHCSLPELTSMELDHEVRHSRTILAELLDRPVVGFAYPYGHVGKRELDAVRDAGYNYACAVGHRVARSPFALTRTHISQRDTSARMWLHRLRNAGRRW